MSQDFAKNQQPELDEQNQELGRLPYSAPQIVSVELLETAAGSCDGTNGFGKSADVGCNPFTTGS